MPDWSQFRALPFLPWAVAVAFAGCSAPENVEELWQEVKAHQARGDWRAEDAALEKICRLQPPNVEQWKHLAWSRAYVRSNEQDDYRLRYHWVRKGVESLLEGLDHNPDDFVLVDYVSWIVGYRIGRSDEWQRFRPLFRDDAEFQAKLAKYVPVEPGTTDNWLVAEAWARRAIAVFPKNPGPGEGTVEATRGGGPPQPPKSLLIVTSLPPMIRANLATTLQEQEEGCSDEQARDAWKAAAEAFQGLEGRFSAKEEEIINLDYWKWRCAIEQETKVIEARRQLQALIPDHRNNAELYEPMFAAWITVLSDHPKLTEGDDLADRLRVHLRDYKILFRQSKSADHLAMLLDQLEAPSAPRAQSEMKPDRP